MAAARYLGHDPLDGAVTLRRTHTDIVDRARAAARRSGDPRWRLIGLSIRAPAADTQPPAVDQWAQARGLEDFGQSELLALYAEAHPPDRKTVRDDRLRARQLDLLHSLARTAAEPAKPHDRLDAWLPERLSRALMSGGLLLLSDLQARVRSGGRWWQAIPKIGAGKAQRVALQLESLIPGSTIARRNAPLGHRGRSLASAIASPQAEADVLHQPAPAALHPALPFSAMSAHETLRSAAGDCLLAPARLAAPDLQADILAARAWIRARAGSEATAKAYRREISRFLIFLDRRGLTLSRCNAEDCLDYMALLQNVPPDWTSKRTAPLGDESWSPFAGPLRPRSQRQAVTVVGACFGWLVATRYLSGNPWKLVNRRAADDREPDELASRAIAPPTWRAIMARLERLAAGEPAAERMRFLLLFLEATGLRAAELLNLRLGDFHRLDDRLLLQVHGKGSRNRVIPVAGQGRRALERYLASRQLTSDVIDADPQAPLLASITDPAQGLGYRSLYATMRTWLARAIDGSDLPWADKLAVGRVSPHWLRHTCGTRALERGVPLDLVGRLLGHADPRTTARYTRAQIDRVGDELERAFS